MSGFGLPKTSRPTEKTQSSRAKRKKPSPAPKEQFNEVLAGKIGNKYIEEMGQELENGSLSEEQQKFLVAYKRKTPDQKKHTSCDLGVVLAYTHKDLNHDHLKKFMTLVGNQWPRNQVESELKLKSPTTELMIKLYSLKRQYGGVLNDTLQLYQAEGGAGNDYNLQAAAGGAGAVFAGTEIQDYLMTQGKREEELDKIGQRSLKDLFNKRKSDKSTEQERKFLTRYETMKHPEMPGRIIRILGIINVFNLKAQKKESPTTTNWEPAINLFIEEWGSTKENSIKVASNIRIHTPIYEKPIKYHNKTSLLQSLLTSIQKGDCNTILDKFLENYKPTRSSGVGEDLDEDLDPKLVSALLGEGEDEAGGVGSPPQGHMQPAGAGGGFGGAQGGMFPAAAEGGGFDSVQGGMFPAAAALYQQQQQQQMQQQQPHSLERLLLGDDPDPAAQAAAAGFPHPQPQQGFLPQQQQPQLQHHHHYHHYLQQSQAAAGGVAPHPQPQPQMSAAAAAVAAVQAAQPQQGGAAAAAQQQYGFPYPQPQQGFLPQQQQQQYFFPVQQQQQHPQPQMSAAQRQQADIEAAAEAELLRNLSRIE